MRGQCGWCDLRARRRLVRTKVVRWAKDRSKAGRSFARGMSMRSMFIRERTDEDPDVKALVLEAKVEGGELRAKL